MPDPYLYPDIPVLQNKLGIKTEKTLDLVEAEQSRANMMLLYEQGFSDFPLLDYKRFIGFYSAISMIGLAATVLSTFRKQSIC